jgi:O-succinylbenzoate synthase
MNWPAIAVERVELREVRLTLVHPFETSFGRIESRQAILVTAAGDGLEGFGECTAQPAPIYSYESNSTAWHVLEEFLVPALLGRTIRSPEEIGARLAFVRGHPMAKSAIEAAIHDLAARRLAVSLSALLGGTRTQVPVGISLGIEPTIEALVAQVERAVLRGYARVKLKIKPGWDVEPLRVVREAFPDLRLTADANAAYSLSDAEHLARLDAFGLEMIEQPLDHEDLFDHAALAEKIRTPLCLDESITGPETARHALRLGACRIINIKMGRVGGLVRARAVHDVAESAGAPVWCGGMLETGIGRCHNLALASLPNFRLPADLSESRRYFAEDIIHPPVTLSDPGMIGVPSGPGLGHAVLMDRVEKATLRTAGIGP